MLRLLGENGRPALEAFARARPIGTVRIAALLGAYGTAAPFFDVWLSDDRRCAVARLDGAGYLAAEPDADWDELAAFFRCGPGFGSLSCPASAAEAVASRLGAPPCRLARFSLLRFAAPPSPPPAGPPVCAVPSLRAVYEILADAGQTGGVPFDAWYVDLSHRIRHGFARAYTAGSPEPVSACLIAAESGGAGLISGVAARPSFRGRGYASAVVLRAAEDLCAAGKAAVLECSESLLPFYKRLGFVPAGRTARLFFPTGFRR